MARYFLNSNGKEFDIEINRSGQGYQVVVGSKKLMVQSASLDKSKSVMLVGSDSYEVSVESNGYDNNRLVSVGGVEVELEIDNYRLAQLKRASGNGTGKSVVKKIKAPMPGLVIEVKVKPGEKVLSGQPILIIEAMKMENSIKAQSEAVVKSIAVTKGQSIEKGDLLIEFE